MLEFHIEEGKSSNGAKVKVVGVGGGGGNIVNFMVGSDDLKGVDFIVANTDSQALSLSQAEVKIHIGEKITKGLGAGSNPDVGRRAAEEDLERIMEHIVDADILFLTAGMGGGTGSGALPVVARAAREAGILSVAVVTKPFSFEGKKRMKQAEAAIDDLRKVVDTFIVVPNQKLLDVVEPNISMLDALSMVNDVLKYAVKGVSDIIVKPGHINVDFADVRAIMRDRGMAIMGTGRSEGEDRARKAALSAISSPLLEDIKIDGAKGVLINITGNSNLTLQEINDAANLIYERSSDDADIILGSVVDPDVGDEVIVTVIASGFESGKQRELSSDYNSRPNVVSRENYGVKSEKESGASFETGLTEQQERARRLDEEEAVEFDKRDEFGSGMNMADPSGLDDLDTPTFMRKKSEKEEDNNL